MSGLGDNPSVFVMACKALWRNKRSSCPDYWKVPMAYKSCLHGDRRSPGCFHHLHMEMELGSDILAEAADSRIVVSRGNLTLENMGTMVVGSAFVGVPMRE